MQMLTRIIVLVILSLTVSPATAMIHDARALDANPSMANGPIAPKLEGDFGVAAISL